MGSYRRLIKTSALFGAMCTLLACSDKPAQQRRELLTPPDQPALQKAKREQTAIADDKGELIPGDIVLGGFPVPRGFELMHTYDNEWYLRSLEVSVQRVAEYTQKRVFTGSLVRTPAGGVRFEGSQLRDAPQVPKLTIRISPTSGRPDACELHIVSHVPAKVEKLTPAQAEAKVREGAKFAD